MNERDNFLDHEPPEVAATLMLERVQYVPPKSAVGIQDA